MKQQTGSIFVLLFLCAIAIPIQSNAHESAQETSKQIWANLTWSRLRLGLGYRKSYKWRFEVVAMRDEARETLEDEIEVDAYMLDLRLKWFL